MNNRNQIFDTTHLERLSTILTYEVSSFTLYAASIFATITIYIAAAAEVLFVLIMLFALFKEKKFG